MQQYYQTLSVGTAQVTLITEGTGRWSMELALDLPEQLWRPFVTTDERNRMTVGFNLAIVHLNEALVLIDTGFGEPTPEHQQMEQALEVRRTPGLEGTLAELNIKEEDVDIVAITHAHGDHIYGATIERNGKKVPRFPRARYVIGAPEYRDRSFRGMAGATVDAHVDALYDAGRLELIEGRTEIVSGLALIPAPGESPGHAIYRIASGDAVLYCLGDLFHHPCEVSHLDWAPVRRDRARLEASRRQLVKAALEEDALLMTAHMPFPGLGRLRKTADGVEWVAVDR